MAAIVGSCSAEDASPACAPLVVGEGYGRSPTPFPGPYARDLFVLAADGSTRRLTDTGLVSEPSVSADGSLIAATRSTEMVREDDSSDYDRTAIVILDANGTPRSSIATREGWDDRAPALSPDGESVAFLRERQSEAETTLMVSDLDGGHQRELLTRQFLDRPSWSPDGRRLAMHQTSYEDGMRNVQDWLLVVDAASAANVARVPWEGQHRYTAWSEDGAIAPLDIADKHLQTVDRSGGVVEDATMDQSLFSVTSSACALD